MDVGEQLPHFSELVQANQGMSAFGYTWEECLRPVRFFKIGIVSDGITEIENVIKGRVDECCVNEQNDVFAPMDEEIVTQVDVRCSSSWIGSIRFHTNMRVSHWFGSRRGNVTTLKAPDGYAIHSFAGARASYVVNLCVLFTPRERPVVTEQPVGTFRLSDFKGNPMANEAYQDMRAVMLKTNCCLTSVTALSAWDVIRLTALSDKLDQPVGQHLVEWLPDERVLEVRLVVNMKIQFRTTHRTTPWYGQYAMMPWYCHDETVSSFGVAGMPEGTYICGFHTFKPSEFVNEEMGVVYWIPTTATDA